MRARANEIDARIGRRIKLRRMELKLSQEEMAQRLDLTFQQIQKYEDGSNRVSASNLFVISQLLNVSAEYFFREVDATDEFEGISEEMRDLLLTRSGIALVRGFSRIQSPNMRESVLELAKALAESQNRNSETGAPPAP